MKTTYCVNRYGGEFRSAQDTLRGERITAVIHISTCNSIPEESFREWTSAPSIPAAEASFGPRAVTHALRTCLLGQGTHHDGVTGWRG